MPGLPNFNTTAIRDAATDVLDKAFPVTALNIRKSPPYPRERRPGRVTHRRSGSRRARHVQMQPDAGVPHAGGGPWAGPPGIRLAIPIGVPRAGGRLAMQPARRSGGTTIHARCFNTLVRRAPRAPRAGRDRLCRPHPQAN